MKVHTESWRKQLSRSPEERERRNAIARNVRSLRRFERKHVLHTDYNEKRSRPLSEYGLYLAGLEGTLAYVNRLPIRRMVDVGAGTGRAFLKLSRTPKYRRIAFEGVGIVQEPGIVLPKYHITSAQVMRGFQEKSVGAVLSVFGPTHYCPIPPVMDKLHALLIPGGLIKLVVMKYVPGHALNDEQKERVKAVTHFFRSHHYDFAYCDGAHAGRTGSFRTFLGIKRRQGARDQKSIAAKIMRHDLKSVRKFTRGYLPR